MPKFDTEAKMQYRMRVLQWLKNNLVGSWSEDGALLVDYAELAGASGNLTVGLFEEHRVFGPCSVHIGVDVIPEFIEAHKLKYPHHQWYVGLLQNIFNKPEFDHTGVWNVDGTDEVGGSKLEGNLSCLADRACRTLDMHNEVAILLNCCLDSVLAFGRGRPSERLLAHARLISKVFTKALNHNGFRRRTIEPELLLPEDMQALDQLDDFQFEDHNFGAFDIHRTEKFRMANLRLVLV